MAPWSAQDNVDAAKRTTMAHIEALTAHLDDIVAGAADGNAADEHAPEGSTLAFERARVSALLSQEQAYLAELERAEQRMADGTYGICEQCGAALPSERLAARPAARTCVQCRPLRDSSPSPM